VKNIHKDSGQRKKTLLLFYKSKLRKKEVWWSAEELNPKALKR